MNYIPNCGEIEYYAAHTRPERRAELLVFGRAYLNYATWNKRFQFMLLQQDAPLKTFQEILQDEFDGDLDEAIEEFLKPEFSNTTLQDMKDWMTETGVEADCNKEMLCAMIWFVMNCDLDDLKELLELEMPSLK
jgi:hypothetical protein